MQKLRTARLPLGIACRRLKDTERYPELAVYVYRGRRHLLEVAREGVVADARAAKGVAGQVELPAGRLRRRGDVVRGQRCQCAAQRVPCGMAVQSYHNMGSEH